METTETLQEDSFIQEDELLLKSKKGQLKYQTYVRQTWDI